MGHIHRHHQEAVIVLIHICRPLSAQFLQALRTMDPAEGTQHRVHIQVVVIQVNIAVVILAHITRLICSLQAIQRYLKAAITQILTNMYLQAVIVVVMHQVATDILKAVGIVHIQLVAMRLLQVGAMCITKPQVHSQDIRLPTVKAIIHQVVMLPQRTRAIQLTINRTILQVGTLNQRATTTILQYPLTIGVSTHIHRSTSQQVPTGIQLLTQLIINHYQRHQS